MVHRIRVFCCVCGLLAVAGACAPKVTTASRSNAGSYNDYSEDLSTIRPVYGTVTPTAHTAPTAPPPRPVESPQKAATAAPPELLHVNRRVDAILDTMAVQSRRVRYAPGYRVQIYVGNERNAADAAKLQLYQLFPELSAYMTYQQPTYRLKVGDFMRRMDIDRYLPKLKAAFPSAQSQPDRVDLRRGLLIR
ncbi:SPOR domain-containing protein [Fibrella sp. HMF5335]|uniref:SPOR domain-containing protein n=1 Tax=Fibrella rubiginis TaxID=2817060 RepID=A0A939GI99_9BACT|nr:SPOR domain-containing protein [Fibrella rubiginis]MBO0937970.1 SPOR domain-containing protein [Fibrella rubiginis]